MVRSSRFSIPPGLSTHTACIILVKLEQHLCHAHKREENVFKFILVIGLGTKLGYGNMATEHKLGLKTLTVLLVFPSTSLPVCRM